MMQRLPHRKKSLFASNACRIKQNSTRLGAVLF
jgi:hypothetical protein